MRHILKAEQFDTEELARLFTSADTFRDSDQNIATRRKTAKKHAGRQMLTMFYEPSTRTRFSFEIAAAKLGINVIGTENAAEFSSTAKGETIEDTVRVFNEYNIDAIVLRTKEEGHAARAAAVSDAAILNGGDGKGEHPTQAALDMYTIYQHFGRLENLTIAIGGDLARGRTARSLAQLISKYPGNRIRFVSSPELQIGEDIKIQLKESGTPFEETSDTLAALDGADVVYWTRLQLERANGESSIEQRHFILDEKALTTLPQHAIILHPLPRNREIPASTDSDSRAKYFKQAGNGLYIRMAMLDEIMNKLP